MVRTRDGSSVNCVLWSMCKEKECGTEPKWRSDSERQERLAGLYVSLGMHDGELLKLSGEAMETARHGLIRGGDGGNQPVPYLNFVRPVL